MPHWGRPHPIHHPSPLDFDQVDLRRAKAPNLCQTPPPPVHFPGMLYSQEP
ncbi:hypothetical protein M011DRAFT_149428 [Sporormia fimetaria CBS 119925]|uniref:Uncharacterized protein n=1 Tax=Sporormia fimetaria CBS 119925 TaxID=1340428 RepID=A0A6A6V5Y1_9PLEO|nr:hypothetical protein M011DRAFT_149428 [Sporormia fimetaria CBS 119925]